MLNGITTALEECQRRKVKSAQLQQSHIIIPV
jgi:hypothetical protein